MHSSEVNGGAPGTPPTGVPGALSNQPPTAPSAPINGAPAPLQTAQPNSGTATGGAGAAGNGRRENVVNYELDKTVRVTRNATGQVKRLTAAVVVNHRSTTDSRGRTVPAVPSQEELEKLTALVQESIGFSKDRGDSVRVVSAPFHVDASDPLQDLPVWQRPWVQELLRSAGVPVAATLVGLMLLLGLVRPALRGLSSGSAAAPAPAPGTQLNAVVDDPQLLPVPGTAPGAGMAALPGTAAADKQAPMLLAQNDNAATLDQMRALTKANPAVVANILRGWFNKES
jgi:flagellar M-ring protein FliF